MAFTSDEEEEPAKIPSHAGDDTASLVIKIINQKTTRQGQIYEVINFPIVKHT